MSSNEEVSSATSVVAVPVAAGRLSMHFGHCDQFALFDVDADSKEVLNDRRFDSPPHQPGMLPEWLHDQGVTLIIAGGMGRRAQQLFSQFGIEVIVGAPSETPQAVVQAWLDGKLQIGENFCDH